MTTYLYWDQAKRREKLGLVWRNRKKISQIINDYLYWDQQTERKTWFGLEKWKEN